MVHVFNHEMVHFIYIIFRFLFWSSSAQLHDLLQLKQENSCLTTIARQIGPYILSIAKIKERLEPRCCMVTSVVAVGWKPCSCMSKTICFFVKEGYAHAQNRVAK